MENSKYLTGKELYGDNFSFEEIQKWYEEEQEAYANLGSIDRKIYSYPYHNNNRINAFRYFSDRKFKNALGIGSAYGDEYIPIAHQIQNITILEPSNNLYSDKIGDIIPKYIKPNTDGKIDFEDNTFDLITCFGVLHHIPNVSFVLNELIRVLTPDGILLIKEPISTMGDWNVKREGLTKNERGIPAHFFDEIFKKNNMVVYKKTFIDTLSVYKIVSKIFPVKQDSKGYVYFDNFVSKMLSWNIRYHRTKNIEKLAPGGVFYIVKKQ